MISLRGRICANRDVTIKTKTSGNSCCYLRVIQYLGRIAIKYINDVLDIVHLNIVKGAASIFQGIKSR